MNDQNTQDGQQLPVTQEGGSPDGAASHTPAPRPVTHTAHPHLVMPPAFAALGLEPAILRALAEIRFHTPSEIQEKMIPVALTGKDIIGQARTGTGKTAAFGLPILQKIDLTQPFQAIVVVPTRELAVQVEAEIVRFSKHKPVRVQVVYGGQKVSPDRQVLERLPHCRGGTPGRIMDLMERRVWPMANMKFVVCDEVDRMFDIGFRDDIRKILGACTSPHQTMFVSATINDDIERMVGRHMTDPQRIFTAKPEDALTNSEAKQHVVGIQPWDKQRALKLLIRAEKPGLAIVFCRTKRSVDKVAHGLKIDGVNASPIHGDLIQNKRDRVMRGFRTGKINVLVATDLASRGIDVHEITHVINYDIPEDPEAYVHRIGRTARMGATGKAFTFVSVGQGQLQSEIEKLTNSLMEEFRIPGFIASPEPASRGHGPGGPGMGQNAAPGAAPATATSTVPAAPRPQEGYQPTGFSNIQPTTAVRPLSGKFPTRRRR